MGVPPLRVLLCLALAQSCQADAVIDNLAVNDFYTNFAKPVDGFHTEAGAQGACLLDKANHIATFTTCHSDKGKLPKGAIRCSKDFFETTKTGIRECCTGKTRVRGGMGWANAGRQYIINTLSVTLF
jgi:hypothetical protein